MFGPVQALKWRVISHRRRPEVRAFTHLGKKHVKRESSWLRMINIILGKWLKTRTVELFNIGSACLDGKVQCRECDLSVGTQAKSVRSVLHSFEELKELNSWA